MSGRQKAQTGADRDMPSKPMMETQPLPSTDYPAAHSMDTVWYAVDENGVVGLFNTGPEGVIPVPAEIQEWVHSPEPIMYNDYLDYRYRGTQKPGWTELPDLTPYIKEQVDLYEFMAWPPEGFDKVEASAGSRTSPSIEKIFLLFKSKENMPEEMHGRDILATTHGPLIIDSYCQYELFKRLHAEGRLQRFWTRSLNPEHNLDHDAWQWKYTGIQAFFSVNDNSTKEPYILRGLFLGRNWRRHVPHSCCSARCPAIFSKCFNNCSGLIAAAPPPRSP